jgi:hypothetical protein
MLDLEGSALRHSQVRGPESSYDPVEIADAPLANSEMALARSGNGASPVRDAARAIASD